MKFEDLKGGEEIREEGWWWLADYGSLTFVQGDIDISAHGYVKLCPAVCVGHMPENFNPTVAAVEAVDAAIEGLKESYHKNLAALQEKRENLLALPAPAQTNERSDDSPF